MEQEETGNAKRWLLTYGYKRQPHSSAWWEFWVFFLLFIGHVLYAILNSSTSAYINDLLVLWKQLGKCVKTAEWHHVTDGH